MSTAGSHGDVLPFVALGREFAARGHEVLLYANPFFRSYAEDAGVRFVPVGTVEAQQRLVAELSDGDSMRAFRRVAVELAELCPQYYRAMRADLVPGRTIAVGNSLLFAPRLLRETDRVPCATVHLAPSVFQSDRDPPRLSPGWIGPKSPALLKRAAWWALDRFFYEPNFTAPLNRLRAELGLPAVERIFRSWIHEADCVVGLFPDWFAESPGDWPPGVVLAGFPLYDHGERMPLSPALDRFLADGPPPVAFSAGTATGAADRFFEVSVEAARMAGLRAILLTHVPRQIPASLPEGVLHVDYAPFGALLPRLAAFVHHGGIGSVSQALRAGVPQLIRPVAYDQFDNAARAVRLGVAREVLPKRYRPRVVAGALKTLAADRELHRRCRQMAARFPGGDAIGRACDAILDELIASYPRGTDE